MVDALQQQAAVESNFNAFRARLRELRKTHAGKVALMHDGKIIEFCDTAADAIALGAQKYSRDIFSVQEITKDVTELGFFSYAPHDGKVDPDLFLKD